METFSSEVLDSTASSEVSKVWPKKCLVEGVRVTTSRWSDGRFAVIYRRSGDRNRTVEVFATETQADSHVAVLAPTFAKIQTLAMVRRERLIIKRALEAAKKVGVTLDRLAEDYLAMTRLLGTRSPMQAVAFYCDAAPEALKEISLNDLKEEYFDSWKHRKDTFDTQRSLVRWLVRFIEDRKGAGATIMSVKRRDLQDWLEFRDWMPVTKWSARSVAITFFTYARNHGYLPEKIPTAAERLPGIVVPKRDRAEVYSPEQIEMLVHHLWNLRLAFPCYERALLFTVIAAFAGIRPAELVRLEWSEVLFERHRIWVPAHKSKTGHERFVTIDANLMKFLRPHQGRTGPIVISHTVQVTHRMAKRLGLVWSNGVLRHSFGSYLLAKLGDSGRVADQMGNSLGIFYSHYRNAAITGPQAKKYWGIAPPTEN